jgi:hypothetical protein
VRKFKLGRGYTHGNIFGDVTGHLSPGVNIVNQTVVSYYTVDHFLSNIVERRVLIELFRLQTTVSEFFRENVNNRIFLYQVISPQDRVIYSAENGNIDQIPMDQEGMFMRAAVVNL